MHICSAMNMSELSSVSMLRKYSVPSAHAQQAVSAPNSASRLDARMPPFGMSSSAAPANPIAMPSTAERVSGWPRRPKTPRPAIQNAAVPLSRADWLVGM